MKCFYHVADLDGMASRLLLRYDEQQKAKYAKTYAFETVLKDPRGDDHGHFDWPLKAIAVNLGHTNSKVFDSVWRRECSVCSINHEIPLSEPEKMNFGTLVYYYNVWREYADQQDVKILSILSNEMKKRSLPADWKCQVCLGTGHIEPYDIMITFCRSPDKMWNVSLYSTKPEIDCGAIAKSFGGGGHRGASGFQCKELPFEI
jgi:hypothetical protein